MDDGVVVTERLSILGMDALIANTQHLHQIMELYQSFYNQSFSVSPEIFHSTILSLPKAQWMLAIVDTFCGRVIGVVNAHVEHSYLYGGKYVCIITDFIIHPTYRRRGVGTWVLERLEHYARRHSCRVLRFVICRTSDGALPFFRRHSYNMVTPGVAERYIGTGVIV
jgi:GNAT superfamily N-acetyltransferase